MFRTESDAFFETDQIRPPGKMITLPLTTRPDGNPTLLQRAEEHFQQPRSYGLAFSW